MLIKYGEDYFNNPTSGMRKLVYDVIGAWTVSGQPLSNIAALQAEADMIITTDCYNKWNNYKVSLENGLVFTTFKSNIMNMYTFAALKYGMNTASGAQFTAPDPTIESIISWEYYDMGIPSDAVSGDWFTFSYDTSGSLPVSGNLIISPEVSAFGLSLQGRTTVDVTAMQNFQTNTAILSTDKMIYLTFKSPDIIPPEKPIADIVLEDFGVYDFGVSMGWVIEGVIP